MKLLTVCCCGKEREICGQQRCDRQFAFPCRPGGEIGDILRYEARPRTPVPCSSSSGGGGGGGGRRDSGSRGTKPPGPKVVRLKILAECEIASSSSSRSGGGGVGGVKSRTSSGNERHPLAGRRTTPSGHGSVSVVKGDCGDGVSGSGRRVVRFDDDDSTPPSSSSRRGTRTSVLTTGSTSGVTGSSHQGTSLVVHYDASEGAPDAVYTMTEDGAGSGSSSLSSFTRAMEDDSSV